MWCSIQAPKKPFDTIPLMTENGCKHSGVSMLLTAFQIPLPIMDILPFWSFFSLR
jgi:hypothetical protein